MFQLFSMTLIAAGMLLFTSSQASTDIKYINYSSRPITLNSSSSFFGGETTLENATITKFALPDSGAIIVVGNSTISISDSHVACRYGGALAAIPYGWYINLSVNNAFIGHICAQTNDDSIAHTHLMINSLPSDPHYSVFFWSVGNYEGKHNITPDQDDTGIKYSW